MFYSLIYYCTVQMYLCMYRYCLLVMVYRHVLESILLRPFVIQLISSVLAFLLGRPGILLGKLVAPSKIENPEGLIYYMDL